MTVYILINDEKKEYTIEQRISTDTEYCTRVNKAKKCGVITRTIDIPEELVSSLSGISSKIQEKIVTRYNLNDYENDYGLASRFFNAR